MRTPLISLLTISYILRTTYCLLIPAGAGVAVKSSFYFLLLTTYLVLLTTYYLLLTPGAVVAISISLSISIAIAIVSLSLFLSLSLSLSLFLSLSIHVILFLFCGHLVLFCLDFSEHLPLPMCSFVLLSFVLHLCTHVLLRPSSRHHHFLVSSPPHDSALQRANTSRCADHTISLCLPLRVKCAR